MSRRDVELSELADQQTDIRRTSYFEWINYEGRRATSRFMIRLATGGDPRGIRRAWRRVYIDTKTQAYYIDSGPGDRESRRYLTPELSNALGTWREP